jgi:hypothetical protein
MPCVLLSGQLIFKIMMSRLATVFLLLFFLQPSALAADDTLSPTKVIFSVEPGENFSYDLSFLSGEGGSYDFRSTFFRFNSTGGKIYDHEVAPWVTSQEGDRLDFLPGEHRYVTLKVAIPETIQSGDYFFAHFIRRVPPEDQGPANPTYELGSVMYVRIGEPSEYRGTLEDVAVHYLEGNTHDFDAIRFAFRSQVNRFFLVTPVVSFFDNSGQLISTMIGDETLVFPEFTREASVLNFTDKVMNFPEAGVKAELKIFDEEDNLLDQRVLEMKITDRFIAQVRTNSPIPPVRVRKSLQFLYDPIFQGSAIAIGLTLIGLSLFMKKS